MLKLAFFFAWARTLRTHLSKLVGVHFRIHQCRDRILDSLMLIAEFVKHRPYNFGSPPTFL